MTLADITWRLELFVPGRAAPQGSKRHVGNGVMVESKAVGPWRTQVAWNVSRAWPGPPITGPVRLRLEFVLPRPVSAPKRSTSPAIKKPDWDKISRAVCDALTTAGVYHDDSQVVQAEVIKRLAERDEIPGCLIQVGVAV